LCIADDEKIPLLNACLWRDYLWENQSIAKVTVSDYLMRIAIETQHVMLKAMLIARGTLSERCTLLTRLKIRSCLGSPLWEYFKVMDAQLLSEESLPTKFVRIDSRSSSESDPETSSEHGSSSWSRSSY